MTLVLTNRESSGAACVSSAAAEIYLPATEIRLLTGRYSTIADSPNQQISHQVIRIQSKAVSSSYHGSQVII